MEGTIEVPDFRCPNSHAGDNTGDLVQLDLSAYVELPFNQDEKAIDQI